MLNVAGAVLNVVVFKKTFPAAARCPFQDQGQRRSTAPQELKARGGLQLPRMVRVKLAEAWR